MGWRSLAGLSLLATALGCGSSTAQSTAAEPTVAEPEPLGPANARGDEEARARVGAAGGTFALVNGARLQIPSGALVEEIEVVFHVGASGRAFGNAERQRALGPMLAIEPPLSSGGEPFEISIPQQPLPGGFAPEDLAFAVEEVDEEGRAIDTLATQTRWQFSPVAVENGRFVARVTGLPGHRVQFGVAR